MNIYTIFWKNGTSDVIQGITLYEALLNSGIQKSLSKDMDFHTNGDMKHYWTFNDELSIWEPVKLGMSG